MSVRLLHGDCREVLATLPDASVDAVVTDPPYELGFMGKAWDASGVAYDVGLWAEVLRVLKPGGHLLAFGGTRTYHRLACAVEDAGFEIRDSLHWLYGSGFPKSLDVSKAIHKAAGAERPRQVAQRRAEPSAAIAASGFGADGWAPQVKEAVTEDARQWEGWGTALKPAHEPIVVARKPLAGTVAANVLEHGTGALNIDGCRVGTEGGTRSVNSPAGASVNAYGDGINGGWGAPIAAGRWPANVLLTHAAACQPAGTADVTATRGVPQAELLTGIAGAGRTRGRNGEQWTPGFGNGDGTETVTVWACAPGCPVALLDADSGNRGAPAPASGPTYAGPSKSGSMAGEFTGRGDQPATYHGDAGGASRFYANTTWDPLADAPPFRYVAKPGKRERNAGLEDQSARFAPTMGDGIGGKPHNPDTATPKHNHHPTVKPLALMRWLVRLATPPGGVVLDPFAGSGTTLAAAILEGFDAIGVELTGDYLPIINGRIAWAEEQAKAQPASLFDQAAS